MKENVEHSRTSNEAGIVVIGRNEGTRLTDCLSSIGEAWPGVVYVDSGSMDGSAENAEGLGISVLRLDPKRPFTAARARNEGFEALKIAQPSVRFVQFIDGDCQLVENWIEKALTVIREQPDIAVVCGRRRERYPERSIYNRLCDIEWNTPVGEATACGGDSLVRVDAFDAVGGYRVGLIAGEEPDLCARLADRGWRIWRLDAEMTVHDVGMTHFKQWWVRAMRSGYGYMEVYFLHKHSKARPFSKQIARALLWGGILPAVICLGALLHVSFLLCLFVYPIQVVRVAFARGLGVLQSWWFGLFMTLAKFAEMQGMLRFCWHRWRRRTSQLIEYKTA